MESKNKKLIFLFAGAALFAAALILGVNALLARLPHAPPSEGSPLAPIRRDTDIRIRAPGDKGPGRTTGPIYEIKNGGVDDRPVTYTAAGFTPAELTIRSSDPIGCVITVTNTSAAPLRVRVGPHDPAGDPGADYGSIAPGQTGILDARYPGLQEIVLHSHDQPEHTFLVRYGEGCR